MMNMDIMNLSFSRNEPEIVQNELGKLYQNVKCHVSRHSITAVSAYLNVPVVSVRQIWSIY